MDFPGSLCRSIKLAALALSVGAGQAVAQSMEFAGTTAGCFYTTVVCNPTGGDQVGFLQYVAGSFDQGTSSPGGVAAISGSNSNFGYFQLGNTTDSYTGQKFLLEVLFTSPVVSGPNAVFSAAVLGTVTNDDNGAGGGVTIRFGSPQTFAFDGPDYTGTFTVKVNNVTVSPGTLESNSGVPVTAFITTNITGQVTATPEPATVGLFATGLVGLIPLARRRRSS
jgi:hypothetical protein